MFKKKETDNEYKRILGLLRDNPRVQIFQIFPFPITPANDTIALVKTIENELPGVKFKFRTGFFYHTSNGYGKKRLCIFKTFEYNLFEQVHDRSNHKYFIVFRTR